MPQEKVETVEKACHQYARSKSEAAGRFKRILYSDPIAKTKLAKLRRHQLLEWHERLENTPVRTRLLRDG